MIMTDTDKPTPADAPTLPPIDLFPIDLPPIDLPPIDKVGLALLREGKLLLARSRSDTVFQIPGGKVDAQDASDLAALIREIDEELGVALIPDSAVFLGLFCAPAAGKKIRMVNVKLYRAEVTGTPKPCSEIEELRWIDLSDNQVTPMSEVVRAQILPFLRETEAD
jgi:8-oxo-dGTP diphosphatase